MSEQSSKIVITVADVAQALQAKVVGEGSRLLTGIQPLEIAGETDLSFYAPTSKRDVRRMRTAAEQTRAAAVLVAQHDQTLSVTQIITAQPLQALVNVIPLLYKKIHQAIGVHPLAAVSTSAKLGANVSIGAFTVIGEHVVIGDNTVIYPHVVIYPHASIGSDCILHSSAVIREQVRIGNNCLVQNGVVVGGDGFGYFPSAAGDLQRIPHIGTVILEDGVDLGANSTVDRATFGETRIAQGTKIDNLVMVGHNVHIGQGSILCAQVGISGSTRLGDRVTLGGQVGVADHVEVGNQVRAAARTGIDRSVPENIVIGGFPYREINTWKREAVCVQKLPELFKKIRGSENNQDIKEPAVDADEETKP